MTTIGFPGRWFINWGTALGAIRDHGLIPYDFDVDVMLLLDVGCTAASWPHLGELRCAMEHRGHHVHRASDACVKVYPPYPYVASLFDEYKYRAADKSKKEGLGHDLGALSKIASRALESGRPVLKVGRNVLDLEFAEVTARANGDTVFGFRHLKGKHDISMLLPTRLVPFGPLRLPVAKDAAALLRLLYPKNAGQADCLQTRVFQPPRGGTMPVPKSVPRVALPDGDWLPLKVGTDSQPPSADKAAGSQPPSADNAAGPTSKDASSSSSSSSSSGDYSYKRAVDKCESSDDLPLPEAMMARKLRWR